MGLWVPVWTLSRIRCIIGGMKTICPVCSKVFNKKPTSKSIVCSQECKQVRLHKLGKWVYWKCIEEEHGINLESWLKEKYLNEQWTILKVANYFNCARTTVTDWLKMYGMRPRSIQEDNARRYSLMTNDQKKAQVLAANNGIRKLFKDEDWKTEQIARVRNAQDFTESMPERMFRDALTEYGFSGWVHQYKFRWWSIDFAFPKLKIAIEIDGSYWHSSEAQKNKDARKDKFLTERGWKVIHFLADNMTEDVFGFIDEIKALIE